MFFPPISSLPAAKAQSAVDPGLTATMPSPDASIVKARNEATAEAQSNSLEVQLIGSRGQRNDAIRYIVAHPDAVPPIDYIYMIKGLIDRGDNAQAAFWYYFWQIRIAAWSFAEPGKYGEVSGAISATLGEAINEWAGSDFVAMRGLMARASTFERRLPLYPGRPNRVTEADWRRAIEASRSGYDLNALDKDFPSSGPVLEQMIDNRRRNGFYVGPWRSPGASVPDNWR